MNHGDSVLNTREIALHVKGLVPPSTAILQVHVEEHIGGSAYHQVYRIRPVNNGAAAVGLIPTATYCLKVYHIPYGRFCPRDAFLHAFPNRPQLPQQLDRMGRMGALWQLLIRKAATATLGDPDCVPKVYATFFDQNLRAFGTIEEWAPGRAWRLEMDDAIFDRKYPPPTPDYHAPAHFSSEYGAKRFFMARFARLLREMGASGLAERYDWNNWRGVRRVVLRAGAPGPYHGLAAVDFEPAPGNTEQLRDFLETHADAFMDVKMAAQELVDLMEAPDRPPGEFTPVMPKANPAAAHLLWLWSRDTPNAPIHRRVLSWLKNSVRGTKEAFRLARDPLARSEWFLEQVHRGLEEGRLTDEEAHRIREQINDSDVQLYLQCFSVHVCTLPVTSLVVIFVGTVYAIARRLSPAEAMGIILAWIGLFAVLPLSPGSIVRGLYVAWVAWKRRAAARLHIALALSFWRYVGFLSFPLQMARTFPALARFAASRWITRSVHLIPHYGKPGGLLEHRAFDLFFNLPLTIARLRREKGDARGVFPVDPA